MADLLLALRNRGLVTLMLGHFTVDSYAGLLPVLYPLLIHRFRLDLATVGLVTLAYSGLAAVSQPAEPARLTYQTGGPGEFIDITDDVSAVLSASGVRQGVVTVYSSHTTACSFLDPLAATIVLMHMFSMPRPCM